jgi:integrase
MPPMLSEVLAKTTPPPATGTLELKDATVRGLSCRITAGGSRSWSLRYNLKGRTLRKSLGKVGEVTLKRARSEALAILAAVSGGADPRKAPTRVLAPLFDEFMADRALVVRRPDIDRAIWANHCAGPLHATFTEAGDVTRADIVRLQTGLIRKGLGPNTRRSVHRVLSVFFSHLVALEIIDVSPVPAAAPAPRSERQGVPTLAPMRSVWGFACSPASGAAGGPLALICLTGLRQREASGLRWDEVEDLDGDAPLLRISPARMKGKRAHLVPLSPQAADLIRAQAKGQNWSQFVFPARRVEGRALDDRPTGANLPAVLRASGVAPGVVVHDLRKGVAGGMAGLGAPPHIIGLTLAHAPGRVFGATTSIYLKADYLAERRAALDAWAALLAG